MSDDLIKCIDAPEQIFASRGDDGWRWPRASKFPEQGPHENVKYVRADLIEKLERELDDWRKHSAAAWHKCEERRIAEEAAEAKLAKAVDTLQRIARSQPRPNKKGWYTPHDISSLQRAARTTLAELEGKEWATI